MALTYEQFSAVVPALNEAKTLEHVITELLNTPHLGEVILVDDGSTDNTPALAARFALDDRFVCIRHEKNKGKGVALKAGIKRAKNEVILFLDADLKNITRGKIAKIVMPVLRDEVDLSRARFSRKRGRVTEIAVKPMMRILFPGQNFDQPITGQICGKKTFFEKIDLIDHLGVDIGILFDAIEDGQRIQEVDIGKLEHKRNSAEEYAIMAEEVLETMIKKAGLIQHKYKLVVFTLDQTILPKNSIIEIWKRLEIWTEMKQLLQDMEDEVISYPEYLLGSANLLTGKSLADIEKACDAVRLEPYTLEVLKALRNRRFTIAIVTPMLSPIVEILAKRLGVVHYEAVELKRSSHGVYTGEINEKSKQHWLNKGIETAMVEAARRVARHTHVALSEAVVVAHAARTLPIFGIAGLSVAYRAKTKEMKYAADKTITVLAEVLALVE